MQTVVACTAVKYGGFEEFDFLANQMKPNETKQSLKDMFSSGMACSKDQNTLSKYLYETKTILSIRNVANNPSGNSVAWSYVKMNWNDLYKKLVLN